MSVELIGLRDRTARDLVRAIGTRPVGGGSPPSPPGGSIPETDGIVRLTADDLASRYPAMIGADVLTVANPFVSDTFNSVTRNCRKWDTYAGPRLDAAAGPDGGYALNFSAAGDRSRWFYVDFGKGGDASIGNFLPGTIYVVLKSTGANQYEMPWCLRNTAASVFAAYRSHSSDVTGKQAMNYKGTWSTPRGSLIVPNTWTVLAMVMSQVFDDPTWSVTFQEYVLGTADATFLYSGTTEWTTADSNELTVGAGNLAATSPDGFIADFIYYNVAHDAPTVASITTALRDLYSI